MIHTLVHLKGNARASIYTEPLWNIPFNLFIPYAAIYMRALGVTEIQIGYIITISMISQVIFSLMGGIVTDKLGRKRTTFIFDIISWGIPTFLWAISQNVSYFIVAAIINGVWRITAISWTCLFVEDSEEDQLVTLFSWVHITGMLSAVVAPLTGLFIARFTLIPTIRGIYFFACASMMAKFIILNRFAKETKRGEKRMAETKHLSWKVMMQGYGQTIKHMMTTANTLFVVVVMVILSIVTTINGSFWGVLLTERLNVHPGYIGLITAVKSVVMIFFYFVVLPKVNVRKFRRPLWIGFVVFIISQTCLVLSASEGYTLIISSVLLEGVSLALINPLLDSLQVTMVDKNERARIVAVLYTVVILATAPFGSLAGVLASMDQRLPFVLNILLLLSGLGIIVIRANRHEQTTE